uniref:Uncharacterized protein n=1 Tax=Solanum tuberosum TaxID=4113 RepID=M1CG43_SOLTU
MSKHHLPDAVWCCQLSRCSNSLEFPSCCMACCNAISKKQNKTYSRDLLLLYSA